MICLVTDRRRLIDGSPSVADGPDGWSACLAAQVRHAVDAGVDLIHVREHDLESGRLAALITELLSIRAGTATRIVVGDRIDVALACGADGVHLRSDSIPIAAARQLAPAGFLVGRSVHGVTDAVAAADGDYLVAGTVFPSLSKPASTALLGIDGLRAITRLVACPVLAIGGIGLGNLSDVAAAGAAGFAAIGLFMSTSPAAGVSCRAADVREIVRQARPKFDRPKTTS
jgi:thiamine-phosphate pyrophosphorylase